MCNSTSLTAKQKKLEKHYEKPMAIPLLYEPYYHVAAYTYPNLFIIPQHEPDSIYPASWGFVPENRINNVDWYRKNFNSWNARSENIFSDNSSFKESALRKRCLILSDGFFEPHYYPGEKSAYPHFCYIPEKEGRQLFCFAGLYSELDDELFTCTILTTEANEFFEEVHNKKKRMPLVLDTTLEKEWIRPGLNQKKIEELIKYSFTKETFSSYPVSRDLYNSKLDTNKPYIIDPIEPPMSLFG